MGTQQSQHTRKDWGRSSDLLTFQLSPSDFCGIFHSAPATKICFCTHFGVRIHAEESVDFHFASLHLSAGHSMKPSQHLGLLRHVPLREYPFPLNELLLGRTCFTPLARNLFLILIFIRRVSVVRDPPFNAPAKLLPPAWRRRRSFVY